MCWGVYVQSILTNRTLYVQSSKIRRFEVLAGSTSISKRNLHGL